MVTDVRGLKSWASRSKTTFLKKNAMKCWPLITLFGPRQKNTRNFIRGYFGGLQNCGGWAAWQMVICQITKNYQFSSNILRWRERERAQDKVEEEGAQRGLFGICSPTKLLHSRELHIFVDKLLRQRYTRRHFVCRCVVVVVSYNRKLFCQKCLQMVWQGGYRTPANFFCGGGRAKTASAAGYIVI